MFNACWIIKSLISEKISLFNFSKKLNIFKSNYWGTQTDEILRDYDFRNAF